MGILPVLRIVSYVLVLLTSLCFFYQIVYLFLPLFKKQLLPEASGRKRYAILIPARNEAAVLPHLLDSIRDQDYPAELITVYVVADNCTDNTAEIARSHGARVFTRFNREKIGKGYALNYLLQEIQRQDGLDCYDAFLIFDADNLLKSDYITQINKLCSNGFEAFCGYRNTKNFQSGWISRGYGVWYLHDSCHVNQSRMLLGVPCGITGTGYGFTRQLLEKTGGWNFFCLTEDIEFSIWCASRGVRIGYCPDAIIYDEQPFRFGQSWRQRTRWVQGGIQVSLRYTKDLLRGISQGGWFGYACFENLTLTLWGYCPGILGFLLNLLIMLLSGGPVGLAIGFGMSVIAGYLSLLVMGALTVITQRKRIRATRWQKISAALCFPIFMFTYIPIAVCALFRKFQWVPIEHTVAISARELQEK